MPNLGFHTPCFTRPDDTGGTSASADDATDGSSDSGPTDEADARVRIGFVFRPHGVHGELKVNPETSDPEQFESFERVLVGPDPYSAEPYTVASVRYQQTKRGTTVILRLDEVESRTAAEQITKQSIFVDEEDLVIDDDELLINDLIGLEVRTDDGATLGSVGNVLEHPAHLTLIVNRGDGRELMIPFVADFVHDVDVEGGVMIVELIEGMDE
ncbi:16S rRNA processing protein RimM [Longibacter salinarum]|uniref:Ribosome maturation factor RimM n=1 Tax=Longibacter salinarum TaxID=1850348 RepID=A0A2A8D316_9BACT|nr:ribosome maturation factor RimM [Longibacter salinarum]PEN15264.1 16S rRNA processing protein RimM [Longibacter salinarum]